MAGWAGSWTAHIKEIKRELGWLLLFQIGKSRFFFILFSISELLVACPGNTLPLSRYQWRDNSGRGMHYL
jgi:hypothetical protein